MRKFILARRANGARKLLVPTTPTPDAALALRALGEARWDNFEGRWTRPDPEDFETAERTFSILHGGGQLVSHSLSANWKVR